MYVCMYDMFICDTEHILGWYVGTIVVVGATEVVGDKVGMGVQGGNVLGSKTARVDRHGA